jgi:hypothetical protein
MIREVESLASLGFRPPELSVPELSAESTEHEINRLTWSVLDGSASPSDRTRLAELVRSQHARRPRASA